MYKAHAAEGVLKSLLNPLDLRFIALQGSKGTMERHHAVEVFPYGLSYQFDDCERNDGSGANPIVTRRREVPSERRYRLIYIQGPPKRKVG